MMALALTGTATMTVMRSGWESESGYIFKVGLRRYPDDSEEGYKREFKDDSSAFVLA